MLKKLQGLDAVLFDFDGLLVNTEPLHFEAYRQLCSQHGHALSWDLPTYTTFAHTSADGIKEALKHLFHPWFETEEEWRRLYQKKRDIYHQLIREKACPLMPGVELFLTWLMERKVPAAVATHSPRQQVEWIRSKHPILERIPLWITREDYEQPKPAPDAYLTAVKRLGTSPERTIGFEDSPRGIVALCQAGCYAVMVVEEPLPVSVKKERYLWVKNFGDFIREYKEWLSDQLEKDG